MADRNKLAKLTALNAAENQRHDYATGFLVTFALSIIAVVFIPICGPVPSWFLATACVACAWRGIVWNGIVIARRKAAAEDA